MDASDRDRWRSIWRAAVCEFEEAGRWLPIAGLAQAPPRLLITAWNPVGLRLPEPVNVARDHVLLSELRTRCLEPHRARGRNPTGDWSEDGWSIAHRPGISAALLRGYGQLAGYVFERGGRALLWADGTFEWLEEPA